MLYVSLWLLIHLENAHARYVFFSAGNVALHIPHESQKKEFNCLYYHLCLQNLLLMYIST